MGMFVTWPISNFGCLINISGMAEARGVKFSTQVGYIKSYQMDEKSRDSFKFKFLLPLKYLREWLG